MTLTEALNVKDVVRRKSWPWQRAWNNEAKDPKRIWVVTGYSRSNHWLRKMEYEDAIATDWEALEDTP